MGSETMTDRRSAMDIAVEFVREQSCGEWDDKTITEDATKLVEHIIKPERDRARRLESALQVAEEALRGSALGARVSEMHKVADKLDERLRAIEQINGGV